MIMSIQRTLIGSDGLETIASQILRRTSRKDMFLDVQKSLLDGLFQVRIFFRHAAIVCITVKFVGAVALCGRNYVRRIFVCLPIAITGHRPRGPTSDGLHRRIFNDGRFEDRGRINLVRSIWMEFIGKPLHFFKFLFFRNHGLTGMGLLSIQSFLSIILTFAVSSVTAFILHLNGLL